MRVLIAVNRMFLPDYARKVLSTFLFCLVFCLVSSMSSFLELMEQGEALGLQDKILEQQKHERKERQAEREERRRRKISCKGERRQAVKEREERKAERKKKIKLIEIAIKDKPSVLPSPDPVFRPSLPSYKDEEDIITRPACCQKRRCEYRPV